MKTPCIPDPCNGRGVCTVDGDHFECECTAVWQGDTCEEGEDEKMKMNIQLLEHSHTYTFNKLLEAKLVRQRLVMVNTS